MEKKPTTATVQFEFDSDFQYRPELLPLLLRNIVVCMSVNIEGDFELFGAYMRVVERLDHAFARELFADEFSED